jgi:hypothetical protein
MLVAVGALLLTAQTDGWLARATYILIEGVGLFG